jgi:hypothetical protein
MQAKKAVFKLNNGYGFLYQRTKIPEVQPDNEIEKPVGNIRLDPCLEACEYITCCMS